MPKSPQIKKVVLTTFLSIFLPNNISADALDLKVDCSDILGKINFSLSDILNLNSSLGSCSFISDDSELDQCSQKIKRSIVEAQQLLGVQNHSVKCGQLTNIHSDINQKLETALRKGLSLTSRAAKTIRSGSGNNYFMGGESSLKTIEGITKDALALSTIPKYEDREKMALAAEQENSECKNKDDAISAIACAFKSGIDSFAQKQKQEDEFEENKLSKISATIDAATLPDYSIVFPSEKARNKYPLEMRNKYLQISQQSMEADTLITSALNSIKNHRKNMIKVSNFKGSIVSTIDYADITKKRILNRTTGKTP